MACVEMFRVCFVSIDYSIFSS